MYLPLFRNHPFIQTAFCFLYHLDQWINLDVFHKEFFFSTMTKSEADAKTFCVQQGGILYEPNYRLLVIDVVDHAEKEALGDFWLGINDKNTEGNFVFDSDSSSVNNLLLDWICLIFSYSITYSLMG